MRSLARCSNRRTLSWSLALRDLEQARRPEVREERLRTSAGLRGTPAIALSAWRGVSGKRYVVSIHDLADAPKIEYAGAVVLGVRRHEDGIAVLLGAGHIGSIVECAAQASLDGATELHVHRLADTAEERDAMVRDLVDDDVG